MKNNYNGKHIFQYAFYLELLVMLFLINKEALLKEQSDKFFVSFKYINNVGYLES